MSFGIRRMGVFAAVGQRANLLLMQGKILLSGYAAFLLICGGLALFAVWRDHHQTTERAILATAATAQLMQVNAQRAIEAGDSLVLALQTAMSEWDMLDQQEGTRIWRALTLQMQAMPQVSSFWVIEAAGGTNVMENWGYPSRKTGPYRHRGYVQAHLDGERGLYIEPSEIGTVTGQRRFTLSRAVRDGQGRLRAVVVVGIFGDSIAQSFRDAALNGEGGFSLTTLDGDLLARTPESDADHPAVLAEVLRSLREGSATAAGDGQSIVAARRLEGFPLAVAAHIPLAVVMEPWRRRTAWTAALTGAAVLAFGILVAFGLRLARSEREARLGLEAMNRELDRRVRERTAELEHALRIAETASAAKGKFLAAISHDLRQPLQGQAMFTELALGQIRDDGLRRLGEMTLAALEAGRRLLDDLVDLARLESGVVRPQPVPVPLAPLLQRVVAVARPAAACKGVELRVVPADAVVLSDPVRLQQIIQNLLSNAIKYTQRGKVLLGCRRAGAMLRIEVWDTGKGIPPEHLDLIFEEFYQVDNPARNSSEGVGLGLTIVERTARLFGHPLGVRSTVGKGSVFSVSVPLASAESPPCSTPPLAYDGVPFP